MEEGGKYWSQWSTYNNGWYLKSMGDAAVAVALLASPSITEDQLRNVMWNSLGIAYNKDFAFPKYAAAKNLGLPRSNEIRFNSNGLKGDGEYIGQTFDGGFIWCKFGDYDNIRMLLK